MVLFPGSRLHEQSTTSESTSRAARWEPMPAESERFYQQLSNKLRPIYNVWKQGAVLSPWLAAQAHLTGDYTHIEALDAVLSECDLVSYRGFVHDEFSQDLHHLAQGLAERVTQVRQAALPARVKSTGQTTDSLSDNLFANVSSRREESCDS